MKAQCPYTQWMVCERPANYDGVNIKHNIRLLFKNSNKTTEEKREQIKWLIKNEKNNNRYYEIPCGKCACCKKNEAKEWATRLKMEILKPNAKGGWFHEHVYMILLTYNNENLPKITKNNKNYAVVDKRHVELFLKKYRKYSGANCSYYLIAEYGDRTDRPHYHMVLMTDKELNINMRKATITKKGNPTFQAVDLEKWWGKGFVKVSPDIRYRDPNKAINYVSNYVNKVGFRKKHIVKEFRSTSRRPALGRWYFEAYYQDIFTWNENDKQGVFCFDGCYAKAPLYFERLLKQKDLKLWEFVKTQKYKFTIKNLLEDIKVKNKTSLEEIEKSVKLKSLEEIDDCEDWYNDHMYEYGTHDHIEYFKDIRQEKKQEANRELSNFIDVVKYRQKIRQIEWCEANREEQKIKLYANIAERIFSNKVKENMERQDEIPVPISKFDLCLYDFI